MRRPIGAILFVLAVWFFYQFGISGAHAAAAAQKPSGSWIPFLMLGSSYPYDAAMLAAAIWAIGLGLLMVILPEGTAGIPSHVPPTSRWAQTLRSQQKASPMASLFVLDACLLVTMLFLAYVGAKPPVLKVHYAAVFSLVAALQIAAGLILLILALFEKPRGVQRLVWGGALYAAGTAVGVIVFLWGQPIPA